MGSGCSQTARRAWSVSDGSVWRKLWPNAAFVFLLFVFLGSQPGCSGCRDSADAAKKQAEKLAQEKPKPKPDFERFRFTVQLGDPKIVPQAVKPGHWHAALLESKANNFDFLGELSTAPTDPAGNPLDLVLAPYQLSGTRPAILAKGQPKAFDVMLYVPLGEREGQLTPPRTKTWFKNSLITQAASQIKEEMDLVEHMPDYQYYLLVLSRLPDRYRYLRVLDSVRPPSELMDNESSDFYYRVATPNVSQRIPLPPVSLAWTSLAYLLWDDIDPARLSAEQQQALVDWLHWGGQLVISGPHSLDALRGSFLDPYLPAQSSAGRPLDEAALATLSDHWTLKEKGEPVRPIKPLKPWSGVSLELRPEGRFIPDTGELVAERQVGRGRVVVSAFRLHERELINWHGFDGFFNGCLLRRPPRKFKLSEFQLAVDWANDQQRFDPALMTRVRYFARDSDDRLTRDQTARQVNESALRHHEPGLMVDDVVRHLSQPGVAGWNDVGPVPEAVRQSLREAAGITVPPREFVLGVLAAYLVVLVPLNWLLFWLIGRVEWAWAAAPVIAVICGLAVVRMANLNIGFARAKNEIAVMEVHAGYPRAHVARYTALYTSLSTHYRMEFDDPAALAEPFPTDADFQPVAGQDRPLVTLRRDAGMHLSGLEIASNSTGMVHSEQMLDLGGAIEWRQLALPHVINNTKYTFSGAGVVRCTGRGDADEPDLEGFWIGRFAPGDDAVLDFSKPQERLVQRRRDDPMTASSYAEGTINLAELVALAEERGRFAPGEVRMVAWMDQELPGVKVSPVASQARYAAMVVAHLHRPAEPQPVPDRNTRFDISTLSWEQILEENEKDSEAPAEKIPAK